MKKALVLIALFAIPVSVYLLFATAVNHFSYLPVLTKNVNHLEDFKSMDGEKIDLKGDFTVLCFFGKNIKKMRGNAFNLNIEIYKKFYIYKGFQCLVLAENGTQDEAKKLINDLHNFSGGTMRKWRFAFGSPEAIQQYFKSLHTDVHLNKDNATPFVFIIDKDGNLRGRKKEDTFEYPSMYGYDTRSPGTLHTKMNDDLKVLMAEYRLKAKTKELDISVKHKK